MQDDLHQNYAAAGFGGRLRFGDRPVLLIVDVVMAYLKPGSPLYAGVETALASNERLVAAARAAGVPVIFTNVVYEPDGADGGLFFKKVPALRAFTRGSPDGAFPATLQPRANEMVVSKQYPSAFFGTSLASTLHAAGFDTVMITGFSTSGCVRATALDALCHGFAPFVIREACGDRDERPHAQNLFDIAAKMAEVVSEKDAIALMQKGRIHG
jgi:maleamate amidohydrolase